MLLLLVSCGKAEEVLPQAEVLPTETPTPSPTPAPTPTPMPAKLKLTVIRPDTGEAPEDAGFVITDEGGETVFSESGDTAEAELTAGGHYRLTVSGADCHKRTYELSPESGENELRCILMPVSVGNDAYVLLEWDGEQDVDLCAFNPRKQEYVFFARPVDFEGDYLVADNDASKGYELLCLRNVLAERAKTVFVVDTEGAKSGGASYMARDGVRLLASDNLGMVYSCVMDEKECAAVWEAFYFFGGEAINSQEKYSCDMSPYGWLTGAEK